MKTNIANFGLLILICACFVTCNVENPIMDKWWPEPQPQDKPVTFYTVTFKENGGIPAIANQKIAADGKVGKVPALSNGNNGFGGWYTDQTFTHQWNFATDTVSDKVTDNDGVLTLYAKWVSPSEPPPVPPPLPLPPMWEPPLPAPPSVYKVVFEPDGGRPIPDYQLIAEGGKVVEPTALRKSDDGSGSWYGFGGWYTDEDCTDGNEWNFATDTVSTAADDNGFLILYAKWANPPPAPVSHWSVTFDTEGGTPEPRPQDLMGGSKIVEPFAMNRDGYFFAGWYSDPGFTQAWDFATDTLSDISGDNYITLYAKWVTVYYTITFNANGGVPAPRDQIVAYGTKVTFPSVMRKSGSGFGGWYTDSGFSSECNFDDPVYADMTLYAQWGDEKFTVVFDSYDDGLAPPSSSQHGSSLPENQVIADGGKIIEPPDPSRAGFCFAGWCVNKTDKGPNSKWWDFDDPVTDDIPEIVPGSDNSLTLTLYAFWVREDPNMVWVKKGSFIMGDDHVTGAKPARKVTINNGFYINKYPVTQAEFNSVMMVSPAHANHFIASGDTAPVDSVFWDEAVEYCNKLSTTPDLITGNVVTSGNLQAFYSGSDLSITANFNNSGYRLPTEAEWEYAARGGNGSPGNYIYAGSDTPDDVGWFNTNSGSMTRPVGTKQPNGLGIYDMSGNIMEWCWDLYDANYYTSGDDTDPKGPSGSDGPKTSGEPRVRRGGSWNNAYGNIRTTIRNSFKQDTGTRSEYWTLGFRVVRGPVSGPSYTGDD